MTTLGGGMVAAVARVEVMLPTWSVGRRVEGAATTRRLAAAWRRVRRHVAVAALSLLAGILLWLPGGFGLGLTSRMVIGVATGAGIAAIATTVSLSLR